MYISESDLRAYIQESLLAQGLDDNADGAADEGMFDSVYSAVEAEIHSYLEGRYAVPLTGRIPALVQSACLALCAEALWLRRGNAGDQNPFSKAADAIRKRLAAVAEGKPLAFDREDAGGAGAVISEPALTGGERVAL